MIKLAKAIYRALTIFTNKLADIAGNPLVFSGMILLAIAWFVAGAFMQYDSGWYDIMDVFVFMTTFFLVFIVQSSQNADMQAVQDKLDEILDVLPRADKSKEKEEKRLKKGTKR